jgi:hypothetical protein
LDSKWDVTVQRRGEIGPQDCHIQHGDQCRTDYAIHLGFANFSVLYAKAVTHREKYGCARGALDDVRGFGRWQTVMNVAQIKDEIRKLNQIDKVEIFKWIDREAVASDLSRIGAYRSIQIRRV